MDGTFLRFEQRPALAERHDLLPHPEGGWYRRTWVSDHTVQTDRGQRDAASAIHYLLPDGQGSRWHAVASDEMWLWHGPGLLELWLEPEPTPRLLGSPDRQDTDQQVVVPAGTWQRASAHGDVLVSCVVCPGFDFADFQLRDH
ncbi:MAG: cupin domain-containing protein [Actinophytocola sp.]|nr:cupin domain-containing protein [Actinophytocola sp.]